MDAFDYPDQLPLSPVSGPVHASVTLPGSKSITNRALLLTALADGESILHQPLHSEDTYYMARALGQMGVTIQRETSGEFRIQGRGGTFSAPEKPLLIGNSGTTIRFLTAAACLTPPRTDVVLDGIARMRERPIRDLIGALITLGVNAQCVNGHGCPPVRVYGGGLPGGKCKLRGDISSQYLSALLQIAPYAQRDVEIEIIGELVSKPYIALTQAIMCAFGVEFENDDYRFLRVRAGQRYQPQNFTVEADASNASYFMAAAAVTGGKVTLSNLGSNSLQGDVRFTNVLEQMGCAVTLGAQITVTGPAHLRGIDVDMESIPDTAQTLAVIAAFANSPSTIRGLASLRVKETDRLKAIAIELPKLGAAVEVGRDSWIITPPPRGALRGATIDTYDDHRMAMSFAVAGLRVPEVIINNPGCVAKTFPDFWRRWEAAFPHV